MIAKLRAEPAAYWMSLAAVVAGLVVAFTHPSPDTAAVIAGACTACATVLVAVLARPVDIAAISGCLGVLVQVFTLLTHRHWDSGQQAALVAGINVLVGLVAMRLNLAPVAAKRPAMHAVKP